MSSRVLFCLLCACGACGSTAPVGPGPTAEEDAGAGTAIDTGVPSTIDSAVPPGPCAPPPGAAAVEVFATPEAGEQPYLDTLGRATQSIVVEIYLLGGVGIVDTLVTKAQAGVSVRLIADNGQRDTNQPYVDKLVAAGAKVVWSDPQFPYMHAKFFVVDKKEAIVSTGNFSKKYSILLERNFVARVTDSEDVADLVTLFEADWVRGAVPLACTRLLVSPINARQRLLALIQSAQTSLLIESMQFADGEVRDAVAERKRSGVAVRALLADAAWIDANDTAAKFLGSLGIPVKSIPHLHTKMLVIDGKSAYLGSENLSYTSLSKNREVGVIVEDAASLKPLVDTFEKDWSVGKSF